MDALQALDCLLIDTILDEWHAVGCIQKLELFGVVGGDFVTAAVRLVFAVQDFILVIVIVWPLTAGRSVSESNISHALPFPRCRLDLIKAVTALHFLSLVAHDVLCYFDLLVHPLLLLLALF